MLKTPKGTYDILPEDCGQWQWFESQAKACFERANYKEIRTPIFESTELFQRGVGESTDIVNKEMYTFEKSDRQLSLRPENTAGVVRAFIEHGMARWAKPVKLFYFGPMFRYERPQAGRQRQFHQLGVECFGLDTPESDFEVIQLAISFLEMIGLKNLKLEVNSLGTDETRTELQALIKKMVASQLNDLCEDCQRRYEQNPLRMLDCKVPVCNQIYESLDIAQKMSDLVLEHDKENHFKKLLCYLSQAGIRYQHNPKLVRGLDYYTKTVFEITSENLGAQNAVCGGGRYNGLVKQLGGQDTPAVGWAMGIERLMSLVEKTESARLDYYVLSDDHELAFGLCKTIRDLGYSCEMDLAGKNSNKQFDAAKKLAPRFIIQLQPDDHVVSIKEFETGDIVLSAVLSKFLKDPFESIMKTYKFN